MALRLLEPEVIVATMTGANSVKNTLHRLKQLKPVWLILGMWVMMFLWSGYNLLFNVRELDKRLEAQATLSGGEALITGVAWYSLGIPGRAALMVELELKNTGVTDLEIEETVVILRDPFGQEYKSPLQRPTNTNPPPYLIRAGETRFVDAGALVYPFSPLTWSKLEVQVTVRPARQETLDRTVRWSHVQVDSAGYDDDGLYHLAGWSKEAAFVTRSGVGIRPQAVVSFYNEAGRFIGGDTISLNGLNQFEAVYEPERFPKGPVASYHVHFIEAYTPYPID